MLDWEGNMVEKKHRTKILLSEVEDNKAMAYSAQVSVIEYRAINRSLDTSYYKEETVKPCYETFPRDADEILIILCAISPLLEDMDL